MTKLMATHGDNEDGDDEANDAADGGGIETQKDSASTTPSATRSHDMFMSMFFVRMVYKCTKSSGVKNEDSAATTAVVSFDVVL